MKINRLLRIRFLGLCFLLLLPARCFSQPTQPIQKPFSLSVQSYYGFLLRHKPALGAIIQRHPYGFEAYAERIKIGRYYWERAYRYPRVGLAVGYFDMGSSQIGQVAYLIHYLEKDLTKSQWGALFFKVGFGLAYCTRPFDLENNFQNIAISTRFSFSLRAALGYTFHLSNQLHLKTGLTITHFSNGAFKMPNAGTNLAMGNLGLAYTPKAKQIIYGNDAPPPDFRKGWSAQVAAAFTLKEFGLPGGRKYPGLVLMANLSRRLNYKSALTLGLDGVYNTALREEIARNPNLLPEQRPDFKRLGLAFGHELFISQRLSMLTQVGIYVYKRYTSHVDGPVYQRYGLRYYLNDGIFGAMSLKSHFGTADFVEWTVGMKL